MIITAVEKFKGDMYNVFVDGEYFASMNIEIIMQEKLKAGTAVDIYELERIRNASEMRRARERALHLLEYRSHSEKELYDKLKKNYDEEVCEAVVEKMRDIGLLNDSDYAQRIVESCIAKHYGEVRVKAELKKKGIASDIIDEVLSEIEFDAGDEITALIERKYARYMSDEKGVAKVKNALLRMGYTYSQIREAMESYEEYSEYSDDGYCE